MKNKGRDTGAMQAIKLQYSQLIGGKTSWDLLSEVNAMYPDSVTETPEQEREVVRHFIHEVVKDMLDPSKTLKVMPVKQFSKEQIAKLEQDMRVKGKL